MWPITGKDENEILAGVKDFCRNALGLGSDLGIAAVERARSSPRGQPYLEAVVEFEDNFSRDRVFSCGPQLASYRDNNNRPTCGLRLQIPGHLMGQFRALENFAYMHRTRHRGEVKKHIKFDDNNYLSLIHI